MSTSPSDNPGLCKELAVGHPLDFSLGDIAKELWHWQISHAQPRGFTFPCLLPVEAQNKLSRGCCFLRVASSEVANTEALHQRNVGSIPAAK